MKLPEIVLVHPQIPPNTGNIARLTAANNTSLHLVEPLGFEIDDKHLRRAGLDYWPHANVTSYPSWNTFLEETSTKESSIWLFTTKATRTYTSVNYAETDYLVFGSETTGLPDSIHQQFPKRRLKIPFDNTNVRSLNLANAAAIALYEARRQLAA